MLIENSNDAVFRPMLFSTPMVQALLDGTKTQTRRKININSKYDFMGFEIGNNYRMPNHIGFGSKKDCKIIDLIKQKLFVNDIIWVRETFGDEHSTNILNVKMPIYKTDSNAYLIDKWKPSLFMPKKYCRLWLKVTNVRVERLQDISETDAINEGVETYDAYGEKYYFNYLNNKNPYTDFLDCAIYSYRTLWRKINGMFSYDENPWVFVYEFEVMTKRPCGFI